MKISALLILLIILVSNITIAIDNAPGQETGGAGGGTAIGGEAPPPFSPEEIEEITSPKEEVIQGIKTHPWDIPILVISFVLFIFSYWNFKLSEEEYLKRRRR